MKVPRAVPAEKRVIQLSPIAQQVWDMKYRLKTAAGAPVDKTVEDTWERVAKSVAAAEPEASRAVWAERFAAILAGYRFLPAGRILAGAGTGRAVTLFNCFVMGAIPDSMEGIFEALKEAALTMQQGGGIGYDFSTLRPKGAPVRGVAADASGPVSFMDLWDAMCRTILSAGTRRGAMMGCLRCDHPDIEAFIDAKREAGRLRMFNLSVLVTDAFMQAVDDDAAWDLVFDGTVHRTIPARALWDRILRATYAYAEPGVIFIDRINRLNALHYAERITATNPCVTGDTWIMTDGGPRRARDLTGCAVALVVDGLPYTSGPQGFFSTGRKPVLRLTTREGHSLRLTADHPVRRVIRDGRRRRLEWAAAGDLAPGDLILLHDHRQAGDWPGPGTEAEGYLLGLLIGDGVLKRDTAILSVWSEAARREEVAPVMAAAHSAVLSLDHRHRTDFAGWHAITGRSEWRLKSGGLRLLAERFGLAPGGKTVTPACEETCSAFHVGLLRGLFDTDGSVQGEQIKGVSVRLAQSSLPVLEAAQRMLLRLGIVSTLYKGRRPEQSRLLPDGKGGNSAYACKAQHDLVISRDNLKVFADRIGFSDAAKAARLRDALAAYRRGLNRETFVARVEALTADGEEEVFDVQVPGVNAFDANGLVVHNCGEQPLPPYGTCLLGSVNLAALVQRPFEVDAALDETALEDVTATAVRLLDDVIDVSGFPLDAQRREALSKRRIGLGVTGLADALIMLGVRYGSDHAVALVERWLARLRRAAYLASVGLAREKGPFPLFDAEPYLAGETLQGLDDDVRAAIAEHGIRNALLTSIAPTGTISLYADNVSSGIEPVFAFTATRRVVQADGTTREEVVADHAWRLYRRLKGEDAPLTDAFVDVAALTPRDHLVMQAAAQKFIDSSISKTINVPEAITFEAFGDVYRQAWDMGCKGCTTYRPNPVTGAVLTATSGATAVPAAMSGDDGPLARPGELPGATYKVRWPESDHALYITLNDIEVEDPVRGRHRRPFEVFINSKNMEHYAWTVALTRMISAVFRRGGEVAFVVEELKAVFDPRGGQWMDGRYVPSLLAAIGDVIERHMIAIGFLKPAAPGNGNAFRTCPKCGQRALARQENCDTCTACGFSRCG